MTLADKCEAMAKLHGVQIAGPNDKCRIGRHNPIWMFWRPRREWITVTFSEAADACLAMSERAAKQLRQAAAELRAGEQGE